MDETPNFDCSQIQVIIALLFMEYIIWILEAMGESNKKMKIMLVLIYYLKH